MNRVMKFVALATFGIAAVGCATIPPELRPFEQLARIDEAQLLHEIERAVYILPLAHAEGLLPPDGCMELDAIRILVCIQGENFFLAPWSREGSDTKQAIFLGRDSAEAVQTVSMLRNWVIEETLLARLRNEQAFMAGLAVAAAELQRHADSEAWQSYPSGGSVVGLGLEGVQVLHGAEPEAAAQPSANYRSAPIQYTYPVEHRIQILHEDRTYWGFARSIPGVHDRLNIFTAEGQAIGYARPAGSAGMWDVFSREGARIGAFRMRP